MKLNELPIAIQEKLLKSRLELHKTMYRNDAYNIVLVSEDGTRYIEAHRHNDFYGATSTYSCWRIIYGAILWDKVRTNNPFEIEYEYIWVRSRNKVYNMRQGVTIPREVSKKKEVVNVIKSLGIFNI